MSKKNPASSADVFASLPQVYADSDYKPYNLADCLPSTLEPTQQEQLLQLLTEYNDLFQGTLGCVPGPPLDLELKPNVQPYHAKPFPIPRAHLEAMTKEVN